MCCINFNENNLELKDVFCGTEVEIFIGSENVHENIVCEFKKTIKKFFIQFCESFINKFDFNNKMLVMFNNFTPEKVISGSANSIVPLPIKIFPNEKPNFKK